MGVLGRGLEQCFQGDAPAEAWVLRQINFTHAAGAKLFENPVRPDEGGNHAVTSPRFAAGNGQSLARSTGVVPHGPPSYRVRP